MSATFIIFGQTTHSMKNIILLFAMTFTILSIAQVELPITFENGQNPQFIDFNGSFTQVIANPDVSGVNTSANVAENTVPGNTQFAGVLVMQSPNIDLTTNKIFQLTVWSPLASTPVLLKLEGGSGDVFSLERAATTTTIAGWETLIFDFSQEENEDLSFDSAVIFMNFNVEAPDTNVFYWDNLKQENIGATNCDSASVVSPGAFYDTAIVVGGNGAEQDDATDALWYSFTPAENGTMEINSCFSDPIGVDTRLNVYTDGCDTLTLIAGDDDGCDAPNDFGSSLTDIEVNVGQEYLIEWDNRWSTDVFDWELTFTPGPTVQLPTTFENGQLPVFGDFNGSFTQVIANPDVSGVNTSANVAENTVPANAANAGVNFDLEIDVDITSVKRFSMDIWSPLVNTPVLLKFENSTTGVNAEREATTSTANSWEPIYFDFSDEADLTFESVTIFMNFNQTDAATQTYYWDNLAQSNFYLNSNGVTCMCQDASIGDTGKVNGITYTKRNQNQITTANASTTCTSGITFMNGLFSGESSFNQDISSWDVGNVVNMGNMFYANSAFNQDISSWDVSNVYYMSSMFHGDFEQGSSFNQDISSWDVGNVEDMSSMFNWASSFNQDISGWDISNLQQVQFMFGHASSFNQDISSWEFSTIDNFQGFVEYTDLDTNNYDALLSAFVDQNLLNKSLFAYELFYCNITAREDLINNRGWTIDGDSYNFSIITAPNNMSIAPDPSSCVATNIDLGAPTVTGGCGTQTISNDAPTEFPIGTTQVLWTLVDGSGIESTDMQTVTVTLQVDVADVCYVSSDQTQVTNNRIFITNDPTNSGLNVVYYEVLRESQSGTYDPIGFITPPEVSFLDTDSNNASQAYRYKIRTTDVCGANYPESSFHKTILLQSGIASDNSINLSWTPYLGLDFSTYNIYKNTNGTGYELLTSLSFNNTTYNDTSANVEDNFYEYYISIEVASCGSDPLLPFNLRSNLELVNPNLSITNNNWIGQEIQIYPNPASDYFSISIPKELEITTVSIYNTLGQLVFDTNKFENIYISELSAGLYYISINTNKGLVNKTMIRE